MSDIDQIQTNKFKLYCVLKGKKQVSRGDCKVCGELLQRWDRKGICNSCYHIEHTKKGVNYYTNKINEIQGVKNEN